MDGSTALSSAFWKHLKMTNVGQNMQCAYTSDAEEIL
jgi:hypothetical protein